MGWAQQNDAAPADGFAVLNRSCIKRADDVAGETARLAIS
jgi:hypothetical protein